MIDADSVRRVLAVVAHPDDIDFGAAGTVAVLTEAGIEVSYCIVTDGDAGGFDPDGPAAEIGAVRRAEQTAAAKAGRGHRPALPRLPRRPGRADASTCGRDISRLIRQVRPQRLI